MYECYQQDERALAISLQSVSQYESGEQKKMLPRHSIFGF